VTLVFEGRGFRITTVGQAVEDARRGDVVRVLNSTSRREVVGRVESSGRVRVSP
jgi:flagella basal body P-ring formation protein FlgA